MLAPDSRRFPPPILGVLVCPPCLRLDDCGQSLSAVGKTPESELSEMHKTPSQSETAKSLPPAAHKPCETRGRIAWRKRLKFVALLAAAIAALAIPWYSLGTELLRSLERICPCKDADSQRPPAQKSSVGWLGEYGDFAGERCNRLLQGDLSERVLAAAFASRHAGELSCHDDRSLGRAPCDVLLASVAGGYAASDEERQFPLAYGLRVHTCATQVHLLLRAIYAPHNFYCIHADRNSSSEFLAAVRRFSECLPNVALADVRRDFVYASSSQLDADLECMRAASASPVRWRYFLNVAGQELPLKANYELVRSLAALNGSSHVSLRASQRSNVRRWTHSRWCRDPLTQRVVPCLSPLPTKGPAPHNLTIHESSAYGAFSREFVHYALPDGGVARDLYGWLNDTYAPDEHYFATLLARSDAPGGVYSATETRAIIWKGKSPRSSRFVRHACILRSLDLPWLVASPEPFANKFYFHVDPVAVRCLADAIYERKSTRRNNSALSGRGGKDALI